MMVEVTYQMVLSTLQTAGILVGIIYYIMTLQNTRKNQQMQLETRQAQLFMQLYQQFCGKEFVDQMNIIRFRWTFPTDFNEWLMSSETTEEVNRLFSTIYYFEGLGVLLKRGLINAEFIDDLMSAQIISIWERMEPFMTLVRSQLGPTAGEYYEYLYNEIKAIYDKEHPELAT